MKPNIEELRKKYMDNPPEGMTARDIRSMSDEEILDMDYTNYHAFLEMRRAKMTELIKSYYYSL
jgi:hypothetical protein